MLAAGTNDCSSQDFECEATSEVFKNVINLAKQKVPEAKDVCVMSVPPRTDSDVHQQKVDLFNACLCTVAQDTGATFTNNDTTFRLGSGVINDGYLMSDGLHLNQNGTNRLVKNAKLKIRSSVKDGNVCKKKRNNPKPNVTSEGQRRSSHDHMPTTTPDHIPDNNDWISVISNKRRGNRRMRNRPSSVDSSHDVTHRCWFCYEKNHNSNNCRFGRPVNCHSCGEAGHKKKFCGVSH